MMLIYIISVVGVIPKKKSLLGKVYFWVYLITPWSISNCSLYPEAIKSSQTFIQCTIWRHFKPPNMEVYHWLQHLGWAS